MRQKPIALASSPKFQHGRTSSHSMSALGHKQTSSATAICVRYRGLSGRNQAKGGHSAADVRFRGPRGRCGLSLRRSANSHARPLKSLLPWAGDHHGFMLARVHQPASFSGVWIDRVHEREKPTAMARHAF